MKACVKNITMLKKMPLAFLLLFCLFPSGYSYGFEARGQNCSKCHTLNNNEAKELLQGLIPEVRILDIRLSSLKGLWEVFSESLGRKGLVYIDFSKKHFITGSIISIKERKNLTQERLIELSKVDVSTIPLEDALIMGDKNAKHKLIVFDDPD